MGRFNSLRRVMGGFMPPLPETGPQPERGGEGMAEALHRIEILGRFIIRKIRQLERQMADQNVTTQQILDAVRAQKGQIASLSQLLGGIKVRLNEALKGEISPQGQAILNDIMSEIQGNSRAITDAIATNDDDENTIASDGTGGNAPGTAAGNTSGTSAGTGGVAGTEPEQVAQRATSITLSSSKAVAALGETISLSAGVSSVSSDGGDKPITGTVTFASEEEEIGKAGLDSTGVAALSIADLPAGDHEITATYGGDDNYAPSISNTLTQTVMPAQPNPEPQQSDQPEGGQPQQG